MRHLVIGAGVVGKATGLWLLANKQEVFFWDKNIRVVNQLRSQGFKISCGVEHGFDFYWVCVHEKNLEDVIRELKKIFEKNNDDDVKACVVVRSTTPVGFVEHVCRKYKLYNVVHIPEFLREKTALEDCFNPDRIVVGKPSCCLLSDYIDYIKHVFHCFDKPFVVVDSTTSEIVKLVSNAWLSTQISFWNEVKKLCDVYGVNPQLVADVCKLDRRISGYGSMMTGKPFGGKCLPKDLETLIKAFKQKKIKPVLLNSVKKVNDEMIKQGKGG